MATNQAMLDLTADRELTGLEVKTLLTIQAAADADGIAHLPAEALAKHMGYVRTEVNRALNRLIDKKLIRRVKAGHYAVAEEIAEPMNVRRDRLKAQRAATRKDTP